MDYNTFGSPPRAAPRIGEPVLPVVQRRRSGRRPALNLARSKHVACGRAWRMAALFLAFVASPAAAVESCWEMDGATLNLTVQGTERVLRYQGPPPVLADLGAEPGAVLFQGRETDGSLRGTAYAISPVCPAANVPFPVEGRIQAGRNRITLRGPRPLLSNCRPDGTVAAATLVLVRKLDC